MGGPSLYALCLMDADGPQLVLARQGEGQGAVLDQGQPFAVGVVDGVQGLNAGQLVLDVAGQGRGGDRAECRRSGRTYRLRNQICYP